jgi:hypothetical protein
LFGEPSHDSAHRHGDHICERLGGETEARRVMLRNDSGLARTNEVTFFRRRDDKGSN